MDATRHVMRWWRTAGILNNEIYIDDQYRFNTVMEQLEMLVEFFENRPADEADSSEDESDDEMDDGDAQDAPEDDLPGCSDCPTTSPESSSVPTRAPPTDETQPGSPSDEESPRRGARDRPALCPSPFTITTPDILASPSAWHEEEEDDRRTRRNEEKDEEKIEEDDPFGDLAALRAMA